MPTLTNTYSFSFNGLTFGGTGSPYQIQSVSGLESLPEIRNQDDNRGYQDGMFTGRDFTSARTISIIFLTLASPGFSAQANYNILQQALLPQTSGTTPLYFKLSNAGGTQFINARVRVLKTDVDPNYTYGYITSMVDFYCPQGFYYDDTLRTASLQISLPPGRTYNRVYNLVYGGGTSGTSTAVENSGWATAYPTITITGPITNPILGNETQLNYMYFTGSYSDAETLVVDLYNKLITVNGVAARNTLLSGNWFSAPPGTSQFYLSGLNTVPGITNATIEWYNAYI
jgi:hypothetical protein